MSKIEDALRYVKLYTDCDEIALKRIRTILEMNFKQQSKIQVIEKKSVFYVKIKENKPEISIVDFADEYCSRNFVDPEILKKKNRKTEVIRERDKFIHEVIVNGYTYSEVARFLKKDHSTIIHSFKKQKK